MATEKEIGKLTVGEFMEGLDYAVKKKKGKIINKMNEEQPIVQNQQEKVEEIIVEKQEVRENRFSFEDNNESTQEKALRVEDTQRTQAIKALYEDAPRQKIEEKKKYNILLLISFALGLIYSVYIIYYCFSMSGSGASDAENLGIGIGLTIIMPHLVCAVLAMIFNGLGVFLNKRGFALTGAILYTVACVLMPLYFLFTIIQAILSYIGFAKMRKKIYIPIDQR